MCVCDRPRTRLSFLFFSFLGGIKAAVNGFLFNLLTHTHTEWVSERVKHWATRVGLKTFLLVRKSLSEEEEVLCAPLCSPFLLLVRLMKSTTVAVFNPFCVLYIVQALSHLHYSNCDCIEQKKRKKQLLNGSRLWRPISVRPFFYDDRPSDADNCVNYHHRNRQPAARYFACSFLPSFNVSYSFWNYLL